MKSVFVARDGLAFPSPDTLKNVATPLWLTKRQEQQATILNNDGIKGLPMVLGEPMSAETQKSLFASDVLILNVPPGRKSFSPEPFKLAMFGLIDQAKIHGTPKLIFISTSAVYGDQEGIVTEQTPPLPLTESGKVHLEIENHCKDIFGNDACILRLAGLVGPDRHPVKYLAGRQGITNGQQRVNLIHRFDVIRVIHQIINQNTFGDILHLCAKDHPSRRDYYLWAADRLKLPTPDFSAPGTGQGKIIDASKTLSRLGLALHYASPYEMLEG